MKYFKLFLLGMLGALLCVTACSKDKDDDGKSPEKEIKLFQIVNLEPVVDGVINEEAKTITLSVPFGTDLSALAVKLEVSDNATVSPAPELTTDFSQPIAYKVTAEDGSVVTYSVSVSVSPKEAELLRGRITENLVLKKQGLDVDYVVDGCFNVDGDACLTIEAGTTIAFKAGSDIFIGEKAGLKVLGEQGNPVLFIGKDGAQWNDIYIKSKRADNQLAFATFKNGGGSNGSVLYLDGTKISIDNCMIDGSQKYGIFAVGESEITSFSNNTIKNCEDVPFCSESITSFQNFKSGNVYSGNGENAIKLKMDCYISDLKDRKFTLKAQPVPYHFQGYLSIFGKSEFTIEPGTSVVFNEGSFIGVGDSSVLKMEGSASKRIKISAASDAQEFNGISIEQGSSASFKSVDISNVYMQAINVGENTTIDLEDVNISKSSYYGVFFANEADVNLHFTQKNVTFSDCKVGNVYYTSAEKIMDDFDEAYPISAK